MSTFDFAGKQVLVTGASRGIGLGIARAFAAASAELTILADDRDIVDVGAMLDAEFGRPVRTIQCDITNRDAVRDAFAPLSRVDVLINNAGLELITPILEPGDAIERTFRRIIDINVIGTYYVTREIVPRIPPGGRIVFTASVWGKTAEAQFSAYCASKHANIGFMRSLAKELGPRGINVNAVCPGWVKTQASMRSLTEMSRRSGIDEQTLLGGITGVQAMPGLMTPEDISALYLFLSSDLSRSITGQAYSIDRGELIA
jgi:NAD(P)-dependent dehydrogenase (short-subunit alcohol dehydrogenase family)